MTRGHALSGCLPAPLPHLLDCHSPTPPCLPSHNTPSYLSAFVHASLLPACLSSCLSACLARQPTKQARQPAARYSVVHPVPCTVAFLLKSTWWRMLHTGGSEQCSGESNAVQDKCWLKCSDAMLSGPGGLGGCIKRPAWGTGRACREPGQGAAGWVVSDRQCGEH